MIDAIQLEIPPGVVSVPTKKSSSLNWGEANLVRWVDGKLQPLGAWSKMDYADFPSELKAIHRWTSNNKQKLIGYLCESHALVDVNGVLYDITPVGGMTTPQTNYFVGGYGDDTYDSGNYGTERSPRPDPRIIPEVYHMDNWGEDLLFMSSCDGRLLIWSPSSGTAVKATAVENAPVNNRTFAVSPHRHVALIGAGGVFNRVLWCDEENITNWNTASTASKAGEYFIQPASSIVTTCQGGDDILLFTESNKSYNLRYIGLPYVFSLDPVETEAAPLSPQSIVSFSNVILWASTSGIWMFASGNAVPFDCQVWQWVNDSINWKYSRFQSCMLLMSDKSEIYFFFPSTASFRNDRYIMVNYRTKVWSMGKMSRSCGAKSTYSDYPLMSDGFSVFKHEYGNGYYLLPGEELPWVRSYNISMPNGSALQTVGNFKPDVDSDWGDLSFELEYNIQRSDEPDMHSGQVAMIDGIVGFRDTGRDFRLVVRQVNNRKSSWTMGNAIIERSVRGMR